MFKRKLGRIGLAIGVAGLLVPLVACSGQSNPSDTSAPEAPEELVPITAMFTQIYGVPSIGTAASDLGIWDDAGLDVELVEGNTVVQSLVGGSADVAWSSPLPFIAANVQGADIKLIGSTSNVFDQYIIVNKSLGIDSVDELADHKGVKVGVTSVGASGNYGMAKLAESMDWTADDYQTIVLGNLDGLTAALSSGQIDMFTWSAGAAFKLRDNGTAVLLGNLGDAVGPFPFAMFATTQAAIDAKGPSIREFCAGFYEAQKQLKADPDRAVEILVEKGGLDPNGGPAIVDSGLEFQAESEDVPDEAWQSLADATLLTVPEVTALTAQDVKDMYVPCSSL
jgi:ABC-type nitrate/sulfonate/bicarbonate transport system substrate-binding protein